MIMHAAGNTGLSRPVLQTPTPSMESEFLGRNRMNRL